MTGFPAPKYHGERVEVEYTDNKCAFFNGIQIRYLYQNFNCPNTKTLGTSGANL